MLFPSTNVFAPLQVLGAEQKCIDWFFDFSMALPMFPNSPQLNASFDLYSVVFSFVRQYFPIHISLDGDDDSRGERRLMYFLLISVIQWLITSYSMYTEQRRGLPNTFVNIGSVFRTRFSCLCQNACQRER